MLPAQSPLEVKHGIARPGGAQPLLQSVCVLLPKAGSARTCVISDGIPSVLFVFPFSSFLPASAVFSMSFFLPVNTLTYYFLKNLISFPANSPSDMASQSFSIFCIALWETFCFFSSPIYMLDLRGFCLVFRRNVMGIVALLSFCRQVSFVQDQRTVQYLLALGEVELLGNKGEPNG